MKLFYSDDPVRDAERYAELQDSLRASHCCGKCAACGDDVYDDEEHYDIDGELVHEECLTDWAEQFRVKI